MSVARSYRRLLRNRPLTRLLLGEFLSDVGDWVYIVALMVIVYGVSGDPVVLGVVGAARVLPYVLFSIPAGMVADRFDRRHVLMTSDVARGLTMIGLALLVAGGGPVWAIVGLAIVATCFATLFYPAIGALLPSLVRDETEFGPANSLYSALMGVSYIVGPAIGGILVAVSGLSVAFILNALTFALVAVVVWSLPPSKPRRRTPYPLGPASASASAPASASAEAAVSSPSGSTPAARDSADSRPSGARRLALRPVAGVMLIDLSIAFVSYGLFVLFVILASDVYGVGDAAVGYLNAAAGIGGLIGAVAAGYLALQRGLRRPLVVGTIAVSVGTALIGAIPALGPGLVLAGLTAGATTVVEVSYTTVFQRILPDELRGRATGVMVTVTMLFGALGSLTMPFLYELMGIERLLILGGAVVVSGGLVGILLIGPAATRQPSLFEAQLRRARGLAVFGGLDPARLGLALDRLVPLRFPPAATIVRQGDVADRFYVLSEGHATVSATGPDGREVTLRRLGPDDVFGELGLIARAPRSATVTTDDDVLVLVLDGPTFIELVGSGPAGVSRFLDLYRAPAEVARAPGGEPTANEGTATA